MTALLLAHFVAAALAPLLVARLGSRAFFALAIPPAATALWALTQTGAARTGAPPAEHLGWVPSLSMELGFRLDGLSWLMVLIVGAIGALVLIYCAGYFDDDEPGIGRFAASLTAFAGAMLGLVISDDLLVLYVFWELTTVLSYLLIGHRPDSKTSRSAATQALVVTTAGGLAMLVGAVLLGEQAGTYRISELLAHPPSGSLVTTATVLLLIGALSKSALLPFHFWLPGAMAAPTPVSAYLHAAAMVKAGVYLVARFAPGFADGPLWRPLIFVLGGATMLLGAWRALRQHDLKLLLAFGTVSQLGFLTILVGTGTRGAALAGLALLFAHALFKACLFLVVGAIDSATGTRDLRHLSGLRHRMPLLAAAATLGAASMAAVPPLLGFVAKEAAYAAFLSYGGAGYAMLAVIVVGSMLTVAYSARFLWGAFRDQREVEPTPVHAPRRTIVVVPTLLAALSVAGGILASRSEPYLLAYAKSWPAERHPVHLGLWHGASGALTLSLLTLAGGAVLFLMRRKVAAAQGRIPPLLETDRGYRRLMRGLDRTSLEITGALQRGSLPLSLGLILLTLIVLPGGSLLLGVTWPKQLHLWDGHAQLAVALLVGAAAVWTARSRRQLRGVLLAGTVGYGTAVLFLLHGAPDLALTQVLVETVLLVVFILVLRRLPGRFSDRAPLRHRRARLALGLLVGVAMSGMALTAAAVRTDAPASADFAARAVEFGGGKNIVNVILVDIRAWDTMGELSVVLVAATGVASLIFLREDNITTVRQLVRRTRSLRGTHAAVGGNAGSPWLAEGRSVPAERRSTMFEVVTRLVFHTIMVWSLYLLFSGHNHPGGGFAAGLVAGLALAVRYLAGERDELRAAAPIMPGVLLGAGLLLSAGTGLVSMLAGGEVLQSWTFDIPLPVVGGPHLVTSVAFDIGVYFVVIGLMLDILRSLGSGVDMQIESEEGAAHEVAQEVRR